MREDQGRRNWEGKGRKKEEGGERWEKNKEVVVGRNRNEVEERGEKQEDG